MRVAWSLPVALAVQVPTIVVMPDATPAPPRVPWTPPERVVVGRAAIVVDGVREPAWDAVPEGPPLLPLRGGALPRDLPVRVARQHDRVVVLAPVAATSPGALLLLDPDGTSSSWSRVELGPGVVVARRCDAAALALAHPFAMPARNAPCVDDPRIEVVVGDEVVEVGFPPGLTTSARLLWGVRGPDGGSWALSGFLSAMPDAGRPLDLGLRTGGLETTLDPVAGVVHARLIAGRDTPRGTWNLGERFLGQELGVASVELEPGAADVRVDVPWVPRPDGWLQARGGVVDGVTITLVARLGGSEPALWPTTPVVDEAIELRWSSTVPLTGLPLHLEDARHAFDAAVDLPAGSGRIRVTLPRSWGAPTIAAPPLLPPTALLRER